MALLMLSTPTQAAVRPPGNPHAFDVSRSSDGQVMRWDPCHVITYRVNLRQAPAGALADVQRAMARISAASGLRFAYLGGIDVVPESSWYQKDNGFPATDADIVIGWARPGRPDRTHSDLLPEGFLGGYGGYLASGTYDPGRGGYVWRLSHGYVVINSEANRTFAAGFGHGIRRGTLLMHELGHAVGLSHVTDPHEVMYPTITPRSDGVWGAGDLSGLTTVGRPSGCIPRAA